MIGNKIMVIGCPGAGKSTFSRALRDITGYPLIYIDSLFWNSDKTHVDEKTLDDRITLAISEDTWIIDGNYMRTIPMRLERCDTVFFLDYPLSVCLQGIVSRIGKDREDMPWTEKEPDPDFEDYTKHVFEEQLPQLRSLLSQTQGKKICIFHSREQAAAFLMQLRKTVQ